jgi:hypothetical protein
MPIDFNKHFYIGCIPLDAMPLHQPKDQTPCIIRNCPECDKPMWVSEKKRLMESKDPEAFRVVCFYCLAAHAVSTGVRPELYSL